MSDSNSQCDRYDCGLMQLELQDLKAKLEVMRAELERLRDIVSAADAAIIDQVLAE